MAQMRPASEKSAVCKREHPTSPSQRRECVACIVRPGVHKLPRSEDRAGTSVCVCVFVCMCSCSVCNEDALVCFLSAELHVFSGAEVSDQPVNSHTAGPHHSLPCTGGSGNTHTHTPQTARLHVSRVRLRPESYKSEALGLRWE